MPYFDHPELPPAPFDDTVIWRYMSLTKLQDLLHSDSLHLTRADQQMDASIDIESQVNLGASAGMSANSIRRSFDLMRSVQSAVFIDGWFQSGSTRHDHWQASSEIEEQIAIRSNLRSMKASFSQAPQKIYTSSVQYIDFSATLMPSGNVFLPALHKQHHFRAEKEVRVLLLHTSGEKVFAPGPSGGLRVPVDIQTLIHALHLPSGSSGSLRNRVISLANQSGLTCDISTVELASALPHT